LTDDIIPLGKRIIEACLDDATVKDYCKFLPMA